MTMKSNAKGPWSVTGVLVPLLGLITGCDFEVTNPGPIQDQFLNDDLARQGIVAGLKTAMMDSYRDIPRNAASGVREIFPGGNTGRWGVNSFDRRGLYPPTETNGYWSVAQNGRWTAENAVGRFREAMDPDEYASSAIAGEANLWAALHNRFMGEHFCGAVIGGGPLQPRSEYFERADTFFTRAVSILSAANESELTTAARAGRASVRAHLGHWDEAVADAAQIPDGFAFRLESFALNEDQWNNFVAAVLSEPFRTITTWNTFYEDYYVDTRDPRVAWDLHPNHEFGTARVEPFGDIPFYRQRKYTNRDDPINLISGREMRLLEAEKLLLDGDWPEAVGIVNDLRTSVVSDDTGEPLGPWSASSLEEAGEAFKKEHGIELWLEGRRLGARYRWDEQGLPGALTIYELPSTTEPEHERGAGTLLDPSNMLCMAVSYDERVLNDNIAIDE